MPRMLVAPSAPASRSARTSCGCSGWPAWRACSPAYTMSFCQTPRPDGSVAGRCSGIASRTPSRLQTRHALERHERALEEVAEAGQRRGDPTALADRDDHERDLGVAGEEGRPPAG